MAYLGKTPSQAVRSRYYFTATGGETSLSGADDNSNTLTFTDGNYVDVALNGVTLVAGTDYNTTTANTIGGLTALVASDVVEVIVYDTFSVFGGNMAANLNFKDNVKANFGTDSDLQIFHDAGNSRIVDAGTGNLNLQADNNINILNNSGTEFKAQFITNGAVNLFYDNSKKLETTATGVDVTGDITATLLKIGTTANPSAGGVLVVTNTAGGSFAQYSDSQSNSGFTLGTIAGSGVFYTHTGAVGSETYSERMRIDSSGNLLVGKTTLEYSSIAGHVLRNDGLLSAVRSGGNVVNLNRLSSDGEIIQLNKDGTRIGSIGSRAGVASYIVLDPRNATGNGGSGLTGVGDVIRPTNYTGGQADNHVSLGSSAARFKDLYLSGGVVFGDAGGSGTSSSNSFDSYEEGSWTASFAASTTTATGYYIKVGATVFFTVYGNGLNVTSTGSSAAINGLPFTNNGGYSAATVTHDTYTSNSYNAYVQSGGTSIHPIQDGTVSSAGTVAGNPKYIMVSGTYITDS